MIDPYIAVALQTTVHHVAKRTEVEKNLSHIGNMIDLVCHICSLELPVRLIALGEGCIQGFADEILHLSSAEYAATMAADIPGWETDFLGDKAKHHGVYLLGQLKEKLPQYPDRFFNTVFLLDPAGHVIYKHRKNIVLFVEHSTTPHDVFDQWVKENGDGLEAFFPVATNRNRQYCRQRRRGRCLSGKLPRLRAERRGNSLPRIAARALGVTRRYGTCRTAPGRQTIRPTSWPRIAVPL